MKEIKKRLLTGLSTCALACALSVGVCSMNATLSHADENPETSGELQLVAEKPVSGKITVPTSLSALEDLTNATVSLTVSATDFNYSSDYYNNDPYVVFRQSEDASYQVWYRVIRNGMLQVFDGKIGVTDNVLLEVNVWQQHMTANSSWTVKVVSAADSAEFFVGESSYGTVSYTASPAAFDIDFCGSFYGYLSDLSCKVGEEEMLALDKSTEIENFDVSDIFVPASASTVTVEVPFNKRYIKNKTTGKYEKLSDLEVKYTVNCIDTGETIETFYAVPIIYFYNTEAGEKIGVRNCTNGIASVFSGNNQGTTAYTPAYHGYYDSPDGGTTKAYNCPYAYFYEITVKAGKLTAKVGGSAFTTDEEIGEGTFMLELGNNGATAYNGITMRIVSDDEYDYDDVIDADYLSLVTKKPEQLKYMTYDEETDSYIDGECKTAYNVHEVLSDAFTKSGMYSTELVTVLSYTVKIDAVPANVWDVPGVSFWQNSETGDTYDLQAYDTQNTLVMINGGVGAFQELGFNSLNTPAGKDVYSVVITMRKNVATIVVDGAQGVCISKAELPEGRPICELFGRGTPATFSNVRFYTTDIDKTEATGEEATFAETFEITEMPAAERFGDALTGGLFTVSYFDGTKKTFTLDSEEISVTGYDEEIADREQVYRVWFDDGKTKIAQEGSITLSDYVVRIAVDYEKDEYLYGEALEEISVLAIMASGAEKDVTAEATIAGYDAQTLGEQTVSVSYGEFTRTYTVTVSDYATGIQAEIDKTVYEIGESMGNVTVYLIYASGAKETVTGTVSGFDSSEAGTVKLTAAYEGFETELTVTVNEKQGGTTSDSSSDSSSGTTSEGNSDNSSDGTSSGGASGDEVAVSGCGSSIGIALTGLLLPIGALALVRRKRD